MQVAQHSSPNKDNGVYRKLLISVEYILNDVEEAYRVSSRKDTRGMLSLNRSGRLMRHTLIFSPILVLMSCG